MQRFLELAIVFDPRENPVKFLIEAIEHKILSQFVFSDAGVMFEIMDICHFKSHWSEDFWIMLF